MIVGDGAPGGGIASMSVYEKTPRHLGAATPMYGGGGKTPLYGAQTPMYGGQTPMHEGGRTPAYGGATPGYEPGSRTPGPWDPTVANTPAHASPMVDDFQTHDITGGPGSVGGPPDSAGRPEPSPVPTPGSANPSTPGGGGYVPADTPIGSAGRSYAPMTPGGIGSGGMYADYSAQSPYNPRPSPAGSYGQPMGSVGAPSSAGSYVNPRSGMPASGLTPASVMSDHGAAAGDWVCNDIYVRVRETHDDSSLHGRIAVIKGVSGGLCTCYFPDLDKSAAVVYDSLLPIQPETGDTVKTIGGQERDLVGHLLSIDGIEGVVKTDRDIKLVRLNYLAKVYSE